MKDIFKFIFTFSGAENIINKTNEEKRKILNIMILFFALGSFILTISTIMSNAFFVGAMQEVGVAGIINTLPTIIVGIIFGVLLGIILFGFVKFIIFKIFGLKNTFLDAIYFSSIPAFSKIFENIFTSILIFYFGLLFVFEMGYLAYYPYFFMVWYLVLDFILMKKLTNNLLISILAVIANIGLLSIFA